MRFPRLRATSELALLVLTIVGLAFAVQFATLPRPSRTELLAARVVKALLRYPATEGTEEIDGRSATSVCLNERVVLRNRTRPLASFVLVQGVRYYDVGHGIRALGHPHLSYAEERERFLLAGCPALYAARVGARLTRHLRLALTPVRIDGVNALRIGLGRGTTGVDLFVSRDTLRPVWVRLVGASGQSSDIEPITSAESLEPAFVSAFRHRVHFV